jgi:ABC-type Mn2+/Zn2+ transport system ATPase subunit
MYLSRYIKLLSPSFAAGLGCLVFFLVINLSQRGALLAWLPRVFVGLILIGILGLRPALDIYQQRRRQAHSTHIVDANDPLKIKGLTVSYPTTTGPKHVLRDVNIMVSPGEVVQLKGFNGSGKSTLLRALADRVNCTGEFYIPVGEKTSSQPHRASLIAYVPQDADENMSITLSIAEQAVLSSCGSKVSLFRTWKRVAGNAMKALKVNDVAPDSSALIQWLSGGQRRRVLLALLAVRAARPMVIALDEPFNDLDFNGRAHCTNIIQQLAEEGCAIILIDHQNQFTATRTVDDVWLENSQG